MPQKNKESNVPWAVSRGLTGAGSTMAIGLTMSDLMDRLRNQSKDIKVKPLPVNASKAQKLIHTLAIKGKKAKKLWPLALVGAGIGFGKGYAEKGIESGVKRLMGPSHKKTAMGAIGGLSVARAVRVAPITKKGKPRKSKNK